MRRLPLALAVLVATAPACVIDPLVRDAEEAGVSVKVTSCGDATRGRFVETTIAVESRTEPYTSVLVLGELVDTQGVVSHAATTIEDVRPTITYTADVTLRVLRPVEGTADCTARLVYANPAGL